VKKGLVLMYAPSLVRTRGGGFIEKKWDSRRKGDPQAEFVGESGGEGVEETLLIPSRQHNGRRDRFLETPKSIYISSGVGRLQRKGFVSFLKKTRGNETRKDNPVYETL